MAAAWFDPLFERKPLSRGDFTSKYVNVSGMETPSRFARSQHALITSPLRSLLQTARIETFPQSPSPQSGTTMGHICQTEIQFREYFLRSPRSQRRAILCQNRRRPARRQAASQPRRLHQLICWAMGSKSPPKSGMAVAETPPRHRVAALAAMAGWCESRPSPHPLLRHLPSPTIVKAFCGMNHQDTREAPREREKGGIALHFCNGNPVGVFFGCSSLHYRP